MGEEGLPCRSPSRALGPVAVVGSPAQLQPPLCWVLSGVCTVSLRDPKGQVGVRHTIPNAPSVQSLCILMLVLLVRLLLFPSAHQQILCARGC